MVCDENRKSEQLIDAFEDAVRDVARTLHADAEFTRDDIRSIKDAHKKAHDALIERLNLLEKFAAAFDLWRTADARLHDVDAALDAVKDSLAPDRRMTDEAPLPERRRRTCRGRLG